MMDWGKAQQIADGFEMAELHAKWEQWVKQFCPALQQFGESHNWSLDTVEYATDVIFRPRPQFLRPAGPGGEVLEAIGQGEFCIRGMQNKTLRKLLPGRSTQQVSQTSETTY